MVHVTYLDDTQVAIVYENFIHTLGMVNQQNMNTHCLFKISLWSTTTSFWLVWLCTQQQVSNTRPH